MVLLSKIRGCVFDILFLLRDNHCYKTTQLNASDDFYLSFVLLMLVHERLLFMISDDKTIGNKNVKWKSALLTWLMKNLHYEWLE